MDLYSILKQQFPLMKEEKAQSVATGLEEKLSSQSLTIEDLKYAEPGDLHPYLELFQARKFIKFMNMEKKSSSTNVQHPPCLETSVQRPIIRWDRLPQKYTKKFEAKKRPLPSERHDIIRLFADDILEVHEKPGRKVLTTVANDIVRKYPDSFQDRLSNQVVGDGFYSVLVQLENRVANIKRRKKELSKINDVDDPSSAPSTSNGYGCVPLHPTHIPEDEMFSLETKKEKLVELFNSGIEKCARNREEIDDLMSKTYILQRQEINSEISVVKLKMEWPILFKGHYLNQYFIMLCNKNAIENFKKFSEESATNLIKFFTSLGPKVKESLMIEREIKKAIATVAQKKVELIGVIYMLAAALDEDASHLFSQVQEDSDEKDFSKLELPTASCLVTKGISPFYAIKFLLVVDRVVVHQYEDIVSALAAFFSSYFVLNIKYSKETACTMEFLQRVVMDINPSKGNKLQKKKGNRQWNFGTKIMTLVKSISDFTDLMA